MNYLNKRRDFPHLCPWVRDGLSGMRCAICAWADGKRARDKYGLSLSPMKEKAKPVELGATAAKEEASATAFNTGGISSNV